MYTVRQSGQYIEKCHWTVRICRAKFFMNHTSYDEFGKMFACWRMYEGINMQPAPCHAVMMGDTLPGYPPPCSPSDVDRHS